jgi:phospholipase A1/A2
MSSTRRRFSNLTLAFVIGALSAGAAEERLLFSLIAPTQSVQPGATIEMHMAALNRSTGDLTVALPDNLLGDIQTKIDRSSVTLRARDGKESRSIVGSGQFGMRTYLFIVPHNAVAGRATIEVALAEATPVRAILEIATAETQVAASDAGPSKRPTTTLARARPAADALSRVFADRIAPHEPIYFVYGPDAPVAKLQFSFKYKLLQFTDPGPQRRARTLQFAFTQRSLWDISGVSSPFYDTSYMPELIYESLSPESVLANRQFAWLGIQAAFKHESNGRDGPLSRSMNIAYARSVFLFGRVDRWHLLAIPEVFTYLTSDSDTADIEDYRGYGKLHLVFGRADGPSLMASAWAGKDLDHPTIQVDLTIPVRTKLLNFGTYLLIQYFNGYGESLLTYKEHSETIRAGFSLVR